MSTASFTDGLTTAVTAFNAFSFVGVSSLTLVAATAYFSSSVHRSGLWFRHILAWIVYSSSFLLLVGRQLGPAPPFGLCLVQAGLIHAAPTLPTLSAFCFVVDLYIGLSAVVHRKRKIRPALSKFLLMFPTMVYVGLFLGTLLFIQDTGVVQRDASSHLYCHITSPTPALVSGAIVISTGLFIFPLEIWIAIVLCRNWVAFRRSSQASLDPHVSLTMFIRVALFTVMSMTGVGLSSISLGSPNSVKPYWSLILPIVPIIAAVIFGSQQDIMRCWVFWREPEQVPPHNSSSTTTDSFQVANVI
ncbi:hypothetical protein C8R46DRAFT_1070436 [Mycena filopes]|nr:hypothetical protein C8R46DRAFT_1070436 [Mycena filopes]